ncbi:sugar dehydrogenase complex small subunit [Burkholderia stabilis]|uniref:sugar dehydrogenase complex small subunit n=1 Tax=Burkholderia stabilis TaxID=95485 RepID=UPI00158D7BA2|nr:sugar dehydrogenase complex small subunit [Burkholderia stabilis]
MGGAVPWRGQVGCCGPKRLPSRNIRKNESMRATSREKDENHMPSHDHERRVTARAGVTRRAALKVMAAALTQVGLFTSAPEYAFAQQPSLDGKTFLALSQALTGHANLDPATALRLVDAFHRTDAGFAARAAALAQRVRAGQTPAQLLADADGAGLHDTALAIVAAWYTGTVGHGQKAVMVTYAEALMYDTVQDGMSAPTYCSNGPLWWTAEPPPADVAPPRKTVASATNPHLQKRV